jgi:two-component system, cell cycle sensor histidine kinase and response regulator CckA
VENSGLILGKGAMMAHGDGQFPEPEEILRQALQDYAVLTLDASGRIAQWSEGAEKIFGWQESEMTGRPYKVLFTPEDESANKPAEELKRAERGEATLDERWHIRKDGRRIFAVGIVRAIRSEAGEITGFSKVARDITEQRLHQLQQEADLYREQAGRAEAEKRWKYLEEIFENLPAAVALARLPEETIVFANWGLRQLVRGRELEQLTVSTRWVLRKRHGAPAGWLEIVRDITERKRLDERLRQADKLESLGVLASGIAHDFNNILTGVLGNISLTMGLVEPGSRGDCLLKNAAQATERAAMLTKQILAYAGKGEFVVEQVNLSTLVRRTMKLIRGSIPGNVHVELALDEDLPPVRADETQLEQIALNLILNAAEAIGDQGGKVAVRTGIEDLDSGAAAKPYDVGQPAPGRYIVLEVADTGIGINPSVKPNIFDPFFTTKFMGRGLGLAALSGIVRALNGAVLVDSTPGQGTIFRVLLPASATRLEAPAAERATKQQYPILVVDDEEVVRQVAEEVLRDSGYEVVLATDGQEALNVFPRTEWQDCSCAPRHDDAGNVQ